MKHHWNLIGVNELNGSAWGNHGTVWPNVLPAGNRFINDLWVHNWNLMKKDYSNLDSNNLIRLQMCTFVVTGSAVVTGAKLWPDLIITIYIKQHVVLTRFGLLPHGTYVEWSPIPQIEYQSVLILGLRPANERRRNKVTPSLIGWAQI